MDNFAKILKDCIQMEFGIRVETFSSKRKQLHVGFTQPVSSFTFFNDFLIFMESIWEHPNNNNSNYGLFFPIPSIKTSEIMFHYIFFEKITTDKPLEIFWDSLCDIISSDLLNSFYVRIIQSREGKIYLRIKKNEEEFRKICLQDLFFTSKDV